MSGELPEGWAEAKMLSLLREPLRNGHSAKATGTGRGLRTLTLTAVTEGEFTDANTKLTVADPAKVADLWLEPGDILVERANTPELVGTARLYSGPRRWAIFPDLIIRARVSDAVILPSFAELFLRSEVARRYFIGAAQGTAGSMPKIDQGAVEQLSIPLAPLPEQHRIVAKVEGLLARVNAARERLERVPVLLKRFRQSVLAKAFRGELVPTEAELAAHEGRPFESAVQLLGKPSAVETDNELPEGWMGIRLAEVIASSFYGPRFSSDDYSNSGIPTIRTTDMDVHGRIIFRDPPRVRANSSEMQKFGLKEGDLLITRTGTIGRCALYTSDIGPAIPSAYLIRFRLRGEFVDPRFILQFLSSPAGQEQLGTGTTAVAQPNINAKTIGEFVFGLPPRAEQRRIVAKVESLMAVADTCDRAVKRTRAVLDRAPQAILQKAFAGELVPREAELAFAEGREFESAEELLRRVMAMPTGAASPKTGEAPRRRGRPRKTAAVGK